MLLSPDEIEELLKIVERYVLIFISHKVGINVLTSDQRKTLEEYGINTEGESTVKQAYGFGILSTVLGDPELQSLTFDQLKDRIKTVKLISPLNALEQSALENLQYQTYNDVERLSNRIKDDIKQTLVFADKANNTVRHSTIVTEAAKEAIEQRKGRQEVVSIIGAKTGQWDKDLGRIADFVLHQAFDEGRATGYERKNGPDSLVFKDVYMGACKHCQRLLLTAGVGSQPKIFKLSTLKANGTNIGRKVDDWRAVIGAIHAWCRCQLRDVPSGFTLEGLESGLWYWNGKDFVMDKEKWVRKVERQSKIKVTVNGKETII